MNLRLGLFTPHIPVAMCPVPEDCIDPKRRALFVGREVMRDLIERLRSQDS